MNRSLKEFSTGDRNVSVGALHRRGLSLNGMSKDSDDKLDLFSKSRRSLSVVSSDGSDVSVKLGRLSVGSVKLTRNGVDDLLTSSDGGKHDYDWLLTPPETPLFPSSDGSDTRPSLTASRKSLSRSSSTAKASRLSITHSESNHSSRPARSSSVTRPSVSSSQYSSYANKSSSILNTSSASVSSYTRPSTPTPRSSSITRPSTPSSRPVSSRSSTPSRTRPGPPTSSVDRTTKPSQSQTSRPSTPSSSRSQIPATMNSLAPRTVSRPSTPTRRNPPPTLSSPTTSAHSPSNGRYPTNAQPARTLSRPSSPSSRAAPTAPSSRPSSPSSRSRPTVPLILPDFLLDIPPNLRTTLPDRPLSAGRSRPGSVTTTSKGESSPSPGNLTRRQSSPILNRGRLTETNTRGRMNGNNGHSTDGFESRKVGYVSDSSLTSRKPIKSSTISNSMESTGFGRNISKKSMDMAMRHMDIRNGTTSSNIRSLTGSSLFPQSIRSAANNNKVQSSRAYGQQQPSSNGNMLSLYDNGHIMENGDYINRYPENGFESSNGRLSGRMSEPDIYESSRYDAILLKEDLKNTNWLHSIDDKSDQSSIFDHGFELLPEPFDPL